MASPQRRLRRRHPPTADGIAAFCTLTYRRKNMARTILCCLLATFLFSTASVAHGKPWLLRRLHAARHARCAPQVMPENSAAPNAGKTVPIPVPDRQVLEQFRQQLDETQAEQRSRQIENGMKADEIKSKLRLEVPEPPEPDGVRWEIVDPPTLRNLIPDKE
jgi:hypothetical protein